MTANTPHDRTVGDLVIAYTGQLMRMDDSTPPASVVNNLTGKTVTFTMYNAATKVVKVNAQAATVVIAASGLVKYDFAAADVDTAGIFWGSFRVTESGETDTYPTMPTEGPIWIHHIDGTTAQQAYAAAKAAE